MKKVILLMLSCCIGLPGLAHAWSGTLLSVSDGDTIVVAPSGDKNTPITVRLYGIDAPELEQEAGSEARDWLRERLPAGVSVEVISYDQDQYGRIVGLVQREGQTLNGELVTAGFAWVYRPYCKALFCRQWDKQQQAARKARLGLWQEEEPTRPDKWRKAHKKK